MVTTLSGAVETSPVVSVHAFESTDPDAFEVPGGREEEWRFTPLRRLRALHKDAPLVPVSTVLAGTSAAAGVTVEWDAAPEVTVRTADRAGASPATSAFVPANRVSARAYAAATRATVVTVPKEAQASRPTYIRVAGRGGGAAGGPAGRAPRDRRAAVRPGHCGDRPARQRHLRRQRGDRGRRQRRP